MGKFEFYDRPDVVPFVLMYEGKTFEFLPENATLYQFRHRPDVNHVMYSTEEESHLFFNPDLNEWMAGESTDTNNLSFDKRYGWLPTTIIDDFPTDEDVSIFLKMNRAPDCLPE